MPDKRKLIIYIDDDHQAGLLGKVFLERENYLIEICLNTKQARAILDNKAVDMIITDVGLPGENGIEFYEWIKSSHHKNIPVLIVSAHAFGFNDMFRKYKDVFFEEPIFFPKLVAKIREILGS